MSLTESRVQVAGWQYHQRLLEVYKYTPLYHQLLGLVAPH